MFKKLLVLIPALLLAFQSKFTPHLNKYFEDHKCDIVLHKKAFDICYSCGKKEPDFVAYTLYGNLVNQNNYSKKHISFKPDYELPRKCRSYSNDYTHSGYDREHNAPNASFDYERGIQKETFLMSNISPQAKWLNRKYWAKVERFARFEAVKYGKVEVITGSCGSIGKLKNNVNIPKWWFKIIYVPKINKTISFLVPNTSKGMKKAKLKEYLSNIKKIKEICDY
ncbi:DNA/RNA non-specific endonuclease [Nautilia lithotrophica]